MKPIRNLLHYRYYHIINIIGLSIALASLLLLFQFVSFELSFDRYSQDLYRIIHTRLQDEEVVHKSTVTYSAVGPALVSNFPEVHSQSRVFPFGNAIVHVNGKSTLINQCAAVEQDFFHLFDLKLLAGERSQLFQRPNEVVLTKETAIKIFGNESFDQLIDQRIKLDNDQDVYIIKGVVQSFPENAHLGYNFFLSYSTISSTWGITDAEFDWNTLDFRHYLSLSPGIDLTQLSQEINQFAKTSIKSFPGQQDLFTLQPVEEVHLSNEAIQYDVPKGDRQLVILMCVLGVALFLISWVNYLNLNGALTVKKSKNNAIRMMLGVPISSLFKTLLFEAIVVHFIAVLVGVGLADMTTNLMRALGFKLHTLHQLYHLNAIQWPLLLIAGFSIVLLMVGSVLIFLKFSSKTGFSDGLKVKGSNGLRQVQRYSNTLLAFQFALSIVSFSIGLIFYQQHEYLKKVPLGFEIANRWVLAQPKLTTSDSTFLGKLYAFKSEAKKLAGIESITSNQRIPGQQIQVDYQVDFDGAAHALGYIAVDEEYLANYRIDLIAGRGFHKSEVTTRYDQSRHVIINAAALTSLGIVSVEEALGQQIDMLGSSKEIIGVIGDFRQRTLLNEMEPLVLIPSVSSNFQIAFATSGSPATFINELEALYQAFFPGNYFNYRDMEMEYYGNYDNIRLANHIVSLFCGLAIIISILGMISMASFNLLSRLKEIGIKKILGAQKLQLYFGIVRRYGQQVVLAGMVSIPFILYFAQRWLSQFSDSINIRWYHILIPLTSLSVLVGVVLYLVSSRTIRLNPVEVLKEE